MTEMQAAGELLTADEDNRVLTYRLLPFGEPGSTNLGRVTASKGSVSIPSDPSSVVLNLEHEYRQPVGPAMNITEHDDHMAASFRVARTRAGDDLIAEAREGLRTGISVELADPVIRNGQLLSARLTGAAACVRPAYSTARLVASDTGDDPDLTTDPEPDPTEKEDEDDMPDQPEATEEVTETPPAAQAPAGLTAGRRTQRPTTTHSVRDVAHMLADALSGRASRATAQLLASDEIAGPEQLFAALTDVKYDGTGRLSPTIKQPQWIGELWSGRAFQRKVIPFFPHDDLTDLVIKGWKWGTKPVEPAPPHRARPRPALDRRQYDHSHAHPSARDRDGDRSGHPRRRGNYRGHPL